VRLSNAAADLSRSPMFRWTLLLCAVLVPCSGAAEDPSAFVGFVEEPTSTCVSRNGVQILVRNTHPSRVLRVWLDRYQMGIGTGDRSRSDLKPGAAPEPLGCSRSLAGAQEWRLVRATFLD
jgi:hypothetical protein